MTAPNPIVRAGRYVSIGFNFSGTIAGGALAGWLIDRGLGSAPWALVVCTLLAVVGGFIWLIQVLRQFDRVDVEPKP